jgi:hypothetical protein
LAADASPSPSPALRTSACCAPCSAVGAPDAAG